MQLPLPPPPLVYSPNLSAKYLTFLFAMSFCDDDNFLLLLFEASKFEFGSMDLSARLGCVFLFPKFVCLPELGWELVADNNPDEFVDWHGDTARPLADGTVAVCWYDSFLWLLFDLPLARHHFFKIHMSELALCLLPSNITLLQPVQILTPQDFWLIEKGCHFNNRI